jgi:hypothetical protein
MAAIAFVLAALPRSIRSSRIWSKEGLQWLKRPAKPLEEIMEVDLKVELLRLIV